MILVDTSVWIDHLRSESLTLSDLLRNGRVLMHPFVLGELACENLNNDPQIQGLLTTFEVNLDQQSVVSLLPE